MGGCVFQRTPRYNSKMSSSLYYDLVNLEYKLEWLMDNYEIISVEKCIWLQNSHENTDQVFLSLASQMRDLRPLSEARILFYWHITMIYDCYTATEEMMERSVSCTGSTITVAPIETE